MSALRPTLDSVSPASLEPLDREALHALLMQCTSAQNLIVARLLALPPAVNGAHPDDDHRDEWLTPKEAAALLRRDLRWIYRRKKLLPWIRQVSPRSLLCSKRGLDRWLAGRRA